MSEWKMSTTACDIGITSNTVRKPQERNCEIMYTITSRDTHYRIDRRITEACRLSDVEEDKYDIRVLEIIVNQ